MHANVDRSKPRDYMRTIAHLRSSAIVLFLAISEPSSVELAVMTEKVWMAGVITRKERSKKQRKNDIMGG